MQQVFFGSSEDMSSVTDNSVQLIVTSPPYRQLKDYGSEKQIGFDDKYYTYIERLSHVWKEGMRVLEPGGRMIINIGDQFTRACVYGRYKIVPIHADIICSCERLGFDFMGQIIRQKVTSMNSTGGAAVMGSFPYPRNGIVKLDFEYIMIFKKLGVAKSVDPERKKQSEMTKEEWNKYFVGHWYFPGAKQGNGHIAVFPEELPKRIIRMFSFVGDTVLDPFLGSGTTLKVAKELGRNGIGFEINKDFAPIINEKLSGGLFVDDIVYADAVSTSEKQSNTATTSPTVYGLEKRIDPRKTKFGNKITINDFVAS